MKKNMLFSAVIVLALAATMEIARGFRPNQIPNGTINSCSNCHNNPNGGGSRNNFGQAVEGSFLDGSGNVQWGASLAGMDSDNDGFTNGEELQDPSGTWKIGEAAPGDQSLVTNPGDPNDHPVTSVETLDNQPHVFTLYNNFPNPFNPTTRIQFDVPKSSFVNLSIYDINGEPVKELVNEYVSAGRHKTVWNGTNEFGTKSASGIYLYRLTTENNLVQTKRMIMMK